MKFRKTYIEITNQCNGSCEFCPKTSRVPEFMSLQLFDQILYRLQGHSHLLHFHVMGEPLLHPLIDTFLARCTRYRYKVNLVTNGLLLHKAVEKLLSADALRQISISLHSLSEKSTVDELDHYFANIRSFIHAFQKEPRFSISFRLWNLSSTIAVAFRQNIIDRLGSLFMNIPIPADTVSSDHPIQLQKNIWLNSANRFTWPDLNDPDLGQQGFCLGLRDQIAILCDGTVTPCCLDREGIINLGKIAAMPLMEILSGKRAQTIRAGFQKNSIREDLCRKCTYRLRFNR